jgi:hypothetical protein
LDSLLSIYCSALQRWFLKHTGWIPFLHLPNIVLDLFLLSLVEHTIQFFSLFPSSLSRTSPSLNASSRFSRLSRGCRLTRCSFDKASITEAIKSARERSWSSSVLRLYRMYALRSMQWKILMAMRFYIDFDLRWSS